LIVESDEQRSFMGNTVEVTTKMDVAKSNLPGPWIERETSVVQQRIEDWDRRAGRAWSCEHARRELRDDEIVYELEIFSLRALTE
jgi:hypothetical protein